MSLSLSQAFVHLRCRSAYSLLEGAIKADALGALALDQQMPAVALTDRFNLFGALEFSVTTGDRGVQPIVGCLLPVRGLGGDVVKGHARAPLVLLLAQNETGWLRLAELSSAVYLEQDGMDDPVLDWEQIAAQPEGLILLSGGADGPVNRLLSVQRREEAVQVLEQMHQAFAGRFYVELQRHGRAGESQVEAVLVQFAYDRAVPLVATNDVYYAGPQMYRAHDALLCICDGAFVGQDDRRRITPEHWFKSAQQMRSLFADLPEACDNTLEIAQRCAFMVPKRDPILPGFPTEQGRTEPDELAAQARQGLKMRLKQRPAAAPLPDYEARLEREIGVIQSMGFSGYFLIVSDFIKWAKSRGIPVGPGRGSGAGSLVAYALTITDLDPLRFGLLFERFLNPERVSMPDFDIDFCQERREEVIAYVQDKYGPDRVAQIITFGSLQARAVLRDVGRAMQMPLGQVDRLAKMVPSNPANPVTLARAIEIEPRLQQARKDDETVAACLETALQLEGLYRNASTHAAGVVIGDRRLTQLVPLYRDPRSTIAATQFNMKWVESAGLVKFDFLGLKTLTVIDRAVRHMARRGAVLDLDTLELDDVASYELMASGQTVGVFQLESQGMRDTLRKMRPASIEEITALISLYRPGPMDNIDSFVDCKFGRKPVDTLHPSLAGVLQETFGIIVYQEQVMQIAQILAGYSLGEADLLRRAMGKKKKEEMDQQKQRFVEGAGLKGVPEKQSGDIFELVAKFAGYGFNKSHAAAYAVVSYQTAWLKANAPVEFFAASMSLDMSNTDKLAVFYQDARRFGVAVCPPDINLSGADFEVGDGKVLYALGAIRNVGLTAMAHLVAVRQTGGLFRDVFDLVERVDPRMVNKRALENLARSGALDCLGLRRSQIVANLDLLIAHGQSAAADRLSDQENLFGDPTAMAQPRLEPERAWSPTEQLDQELSAVGFYLSGHPLQDVVEVLQRQRVTLVVDALARAEAGAEAFRLAGIVRKRQERTQSSGERFAFVSLSDPTGDYEVLVPPEVLRRVRDRLEPGQSLVLRVRAKARDGEVRFFADDAEQLDNVLSSAGSDLRIHVSATGPKELEPLKRRLGEPGSGRGGAVTLIVDLPHGREVEVRLPGVYALDAAVRGALKVSPGVLYLEDA